MNSDDNKRLNYYERQYLRTRDFKDEQAYHIKMRRHHLLGHHTWGIVKGLKITQDKKTNLWSLQPGMAVDEFGREIIVPAAQELDIATIQAQLKNSTLPAKLNLWLAYELGASDDAAPGYKACYEDKPFNRIQETYRLIYQNPEPKHTSKFQPQSKASVFDDPRAQVAPVYLGTIVWGTDPPPKDPELGIQKIEDANPPYARKYVGNITSDIQVPGPLLNIRSAIKSSFVATIWGDLITRILAILKLIVLDGANIDAADSNEGSLNQGAIVLGSGQNGVKKSGEGLASTRKKGKENRFGLDFYTFFKPRLSITQAGKVGIGTRTPKAQLDVSESFRLNGGTVFSKIQAGTKEVGASASNADKLVEITFDTAFSKAPKVIVTARTEDGEKYPDTFAVTTREITESNFHVNVVRVDSFNKKTGWNQNLKLDWFAWE